jgi:hypothetical protein
MRKAWIAVVVAALPVTTGCKASGGTPENRRATKSRLDSTVRSYTTAYLGGNGALAYALLSPRCRAKIPQTEFESIVTLAHQTYGDAKITLLTVEVTGDNGTATYQLTDPTLNQTAERWVFVHEGTGADTVDAWRNDDCPSEGSDSGSTSATTNAPSAQRGSRAAPVVRGEAGPVVGGGWDLRVVSTTPNANADVQRGNQFNDPPKQGTQYYIARVAITRTGSDPGDPTNVELRSIGTGNVTYETSQDSCGVIPDAMPSKDIYPGGTVEASVCWQVQAGDAATLAMIARVKFSDVEGTFFALA